MANEIHVTIPLDSFVAGIEAIFRIEALKYLTVNSKYSMPREEIAAVLGFSLPVENDNN